MALMSIIEFKKLKHCKQCNETKLRTDFYKNAHGNELMLRCKKCVNKNATKSARLIREKKRTEVYVLKSEREKLGLSN